MTQGGRSERRTSARTSRNRAEDGTRASADHPPAAAIVWLEQHGRIVLGVVVGLNLLFAILTFMPQPHTGGDSANYLTLARSLLQHHSYTDLYDPNQPPHTKYPPVFPLLLMIGMIVGLKTWVQLKLLMVVIGTAAAATTYLWIRQRGMPALAVGVGVLLACSAGVLEQSHWLLSDVPFWLFTMLALLGFDRLRGDSRTAFAIAVAATALAYFTRSAGLPLVLAAALWLTWQRRWRQLAAFAATILPLAFLWWLRAHQTGGVDYAQEFWFIDPYQPHLGRIGVAELFERIGTNIQKYATIHIPILLSGRRSAGMAAISLLLILLAIAGWILRLRAPLVAEFMMPLYLGLLCVWPAVWSGERFILPVFPLLLYYAGFAVARVLRNAGSTVTLAAGAAVFVLLLLFGAPRLQASVTAGRACTREYREGEKYPCLYPGERSYFDAALWSSAALPDSAVLLSRKPRLFYEISNGIRGTQYPMTDDPAAFFALTDSIGARYVLFDRMSGLASRYLAPIIVQRPAAFCLLRQFGDDGTVMFGILPGAAAMSNTTSPEDGPQFEVCDNSFLRPARRTVGEAPALRR